MASPPGQLPLVDFIKAVAAQLIVLHHLAWYGPLIDMAAQLWPAALLARDWLAEYGRYAVAAFLAIGGFLVARTLPPGGLKQPPLRLILRRYVRLVTPFAVALILAMACAALARQWMTHDSIGAPPQFGQFVAHLLLLHGVLGYESLSAGVWYVAIDFQLYALIVLLLWLAGRLGCRPASADFWVIALVTVFALASLFHFNREAGWDNWALYFFAAYAFGICASWAMRSAHPYPLLLAIAVIGGLALLVDFRPRIAIALAVAILLGLAQLHLNLKESRWIGAFGRASYALFLVHFPICLLVNAAFTHLDPRWSLVGILVAWMASNAVAFLFHRHVEERWTPRLMRYFG
jgi:peptidoglycan/LPS O-acetylase OafA/YrhL